MDARPPLATDLAALACRTAGVTGTPTVVAERGDVLVVRVGDVVAKAHHADADVAALAARLDLAAEAKEFVAPLPVPEPVAGRFVARVGGRAATVWPAGQPVDPDDPSAAPWAHAGELLASLHRRQAPAGAPRMGGPVRVARGLNRLVDGPAAKHPLARDVLAAAATLPAWTTGAAAAPPGASLVHGDWHLGQLVRFPAGAWRLIDADDLGAGPSEWDLARPAAWFLSGVIPHTDWSAFLDAYLGAGGPAVPADGDPWPVLDAPARALTVQHAALGLVAATREDREPDAVDLLLVETCRKIASVSKLPDTP